MPVAVLVVSWLVAWLPLLARPVQNRAASWIFGVRDPAPPETAIVGVAWQRVLVRARQRQEAYLLRIENSDDVNAAASGGHIVSVTTGALRLPSDELEAVLAHELAHHLGLHAVTALLFRWLIWPIETAITVFEHLDRWSMAAARACSRADSDRAALVAAVLAFMFRAYSYLFRAVAGVVSAVVAAINRGAEYRADAVAVELGYGRPLRRALGRFVTVGPEPRLGQRLQSDHPDLRDRIGRIDAQMGLVAAGMQ